MYPDAACGAPKLLAASKVQHRTSVTCVGNKSYIVVLLLISILCGAGCGSGINSTALASDTPAFSNLQPISLTSSAFGMHVQRAVDGTPWPTVNFGTWRLWDTMTCWFDLEPSRGVWQFDRLDNLVVMGESHNEQIILTLGQTPTWASARPAEASPYSPGAAAEPMSEQDWIDYVTKVVQRYKGRVKYYEIWNEPNLSQNWTGTIDQMLQLQRDAYTVIRHEDPAAKVISPSITSTYGISYLQQMLKGGMANYTDIIGYHLYVLGYPPEQISGLVDEVNASLAAANVTGKELWNTESGWSSPNTFSDPTIAAAWVARAHLLAFSKGVSRFIWYAWDSENWVTLKLTDAQDATTPAATAYSVVQGWLTGSELTPCTENVSQVWTCTIVRSGKRGIILWHAGGPITMAVPETWKAIYIQDALGNQHDFVGTTVQADDLPRLVTE